MMVRPATLTVRHLGIGLAADRKTMDTLPEQEIRGAVVDSRQATPGCLFVALQGEKTHGHLFIRDAIDRGAAAVIAEKLPDGRARMIAEGEGPQVVPWSGAWCFIVPESLAALQQAAAYWRRQHEVRVTGVTGSVGKSTSKEAIAAVLRQGYRTLKSEGNYNNEIGLPLTLLHLRDNHEQVVLEMGMYHLGEISLLAKIARPQNGVVTNVGPSHLERLGTIDRIAQAKAELPRALPPAAAGGVALLNRDDERVRAMAELTEARVVTYGLDPCADVWADQIQSRGLEGMHLTLHHGRTAVRVRLPTLGRHSVHTALSAAAVGVVEELSWSEIVAGLQDQRAQLRLVAVPGPDGSTVLDDTYNSSPDSCLAALNLLEELAGRHVAVLGDMYELGSHELEGHRLVGRRARDAADILIAVGRLGRIIGEEALEAGMSAAAVRIVESNEQAIQAVEQIVQPGDMILVKGSRGLAMEEIVAALTRQAADRSPKAKDSRR